MSEIQVHVATTHDAGRCNGCLAPGSVAVIRVDNGSELRLCYRCSVTLRHQLTDAWSAAPKR